MSDANLRQIRVLHIVSAGGVASSLQQSLFMPLLTRLPRPRVKSQVACLSPGAVPSAVLRQNGVPVFDLALSRKRFSPRAVQELVQATRLFRPDVIQAWGHTAQVVATHVRGRCDWKPRLVWSVVDTTPLAKNAGLIDRQKLKYAAKFSSRADRIVYASEASASQHRRVGFPDGEHVMIAPGVDATRFKPDFAARRKLREQLNLPGEAFVLGMSAPFQLEYDHATLIRAVGELIKTNPDIAVVLAGHGVQKGNAPLMALVGGGALATRVHLLGEWSDISALYNACDVVCSSALNDQSRMNLVMAMLCGVPCVATGMGAQGEVIGQHGVAIEPGSPAAFVKGINRVMQLTPEKRTHMAQAARKHALANYVYVRSLQKYLQLYYDMIGRQSLVTQDLPTPEIDPTLTVPPALPSGAEMTASKRKPLTVFDLTDPDSLESKVTERQPEDLPKWRLAQEEERKQREAEVAAKVAATKSVGDVLQVFESEIKPALAAASPMTERARGVADDSEELLSPDLLTADAPAPPRVSTAPPGAKNKSSAATSAAAPSQDAAKEARLRAARMAALQPIASRPRVSVVRPAAAPATVPLPPPVAASAAKPDISWTQPLEMLPEAALLQPVATIAPSPAIAAAAPAVAPPADIKPAATKPVESKPVESKLEKADIGETQPLEMLPEAAIMTAVPAVPPAQTRIAAAPTTIDIAATQPLPLQAEEPAVITQRLHSQTEAPAATALPPQSQAERPTAITQPPLLQTATPAVIAPPAPPQLATPVASAPPLPVVPVIETPAASGVVAATIASEPSPDFAELSLMATGTWAAMPRVTADAKTAVNATKNDTGGMPVLDGPETLSLIAGGTAASTPEPTLKLAVLKDPTAESKRAANGD